MSVSPESLSSFEASMIAEGQWELAGYEPDEDVFYAANQNLINSGMAWQLQGFFGRQAMALIEAGHCVPADQYVAAA